MFTYELKKRNKGYATVLLIFSLDSKVWLMNDAVWLHKRYK